MAYKGIMGVSLRDHMYLCRSSLGLGETPYVHTS